MSDIFVFRDDPGYQQVNPRQSGKIGTRRSPEQRRIAVTACEQRARRLLDAEPGNVARNGADRYDRCHPARRNGGRRIR